MTIKNFFEYIEIQTKLASLFPFVFGVVYSLLIYGEINVISTLLMYISLLSLDMATTAINNYMDFKKAKNDEYKYNMNVIGRNNISERLAIFIILLLLGICAIMGLILVTRTSIIILLLGVFSVCVGVFYTFGVMPISRMPIGELVSGTVMGFFIVYITVYIQDTSIANFIIENGILIFKLDIIVTIKILLVSLPFVFIIANLMLGNNMRDVEIDIKNGRFLLPYYIGEKNSLILFKGLYVLVFVNIVFCILAGVLTIHFALMLLVIPKVLKNVKEYNFYLKYEDVKLRRKCFKYAVENMMIISVAYIIAGTIAIVLK